VRELSTRGRFKIRGATNKIQSLTPDEKQQGIVAFLIRQSRAGVALAGREAGVRVLVCNA
jgi:threonine dehydratase